MGYTFHRIFCATTPELEPEREAFHAVLSEFDAAEAMPRGILVVPVTLPPNMADLRAYKIPVDDNIRAVRYYVQVFDRSWGPPPRNFADSYDTAKQSLADPGLPLQEIVVLFKVQPAGRTLEPDVAQLKAELAAGGGPRSFEFSDTAAFKQILRGLFLEWLDSIAPPTPGGTPHAG